MRSGSFLSPDEKDTRDVYSFTHHAHARYLRMPFTAERDWYRLASGRFSIIWYCWYEWKFISALLRMIFSLCIQIFDDEREAYSPLHRPERWHCPPLAWEYFVTLYTSAYASRHTKHAFTRACLATTNAMQRTLSLYINASKRKCRRAHWDYFYIGDRFSRGGEPCYPRSFYNSRRIIATPGILISPINDENTYFAIYI